MGFDGLAKLGVPGRVTGEEPLIRWRGVIALEIYTVLIANPQLVVPATRWCVALHIWCFASRQSAPRVAER